MICWKCSKSLDSALKIGFRTVCPHCDVDLHVCVNCKYYSPGKPNDCIVPGTESIRDREKANLCEDYKPLQQTKILDNKKKFNDLFK
jgi:hypothetical protein